jgi:hypothetical protein
MYRTSFKECNYSSIKYIYLHVYTRVFIVLEVVKIIIHLTISENSDKGHEKVRDIKPQSAFLSREDFNATEENQN